MNMDSTSEAYKLLASLLSRHPQTVEILPGDGAIWTNAPDPNDFDAGPSIFPFLFVQGNLGVPQKILYAVYLHAVHIFKSTRSCVSARSVIACHPDHDSPDASLVQSLISSSSILLLANPAHQTALNTRKRLVRLCLVDPDAELRFTASLLSSQHCAKHAELWYHRRWILSTTYVPNFSDTGPVAVDSSCRLRFASQKVLREELELVSRACELYPRNYFAWTHRLICLKSLLSDYLVGTDIVGFVTIFRGEIAITKRWIDRHVSDYSAIHSILVLSKEALQSRDLSLIETVVEEDLLGHAISLVQEYPTHETLWMYIWAALSISGPGQAQHAEQFIDDFVEPLAYMEHSETSVNDDSVQASQHAKWFLSRRG